MIAYFDPINKHTKFYREVELAGDEGIITRLIFVLRIVIRLRELYKSITEVNRIVFCV